MRYNNNTAEELLDPHFSRRREHEKFKFVQRTLDLFVEFDGATLGQAVGLIAVGTVHALGLGSNVLQVAAALATPGHSTQHLVLLYRQKKIHV